MFVKLWGTRGSIPSPMTGADYRERLSRVLEKAIDQNLTDKNQIPSFINSLKKDLKFVVGSNTTCASVQEDPSSPVRIFVDAGTGIRNPGEQLLKTECGKGKCEIHILFTHTHWDHIQGLPFFKPIYIPGNAIHFYSAYPDLEKRLKDQFDLRFFPVEMDNLGASFHYHHIADPGNVFTLPGGFQVDSFYLKHPGGSLAYRFRMDNRTFIFATDTEFTGETMEHKAEEEKKFFSGADLLVMDTQYNLDESFQKFDWGHTSNTMAVNCAVNWGVKHLVMTHHEPAYSDRRLFQNFLESVRHRNNLGRKSPTIHLGKEGTGYWLK